MKTLGAVALACLVAVGCGEESGSAGGALTEDTVSGDDGGGEGTPDAGPVDEDATSTPDVGDLATGDADVTTGDADAIGEEDVPPGCQCDDGEPCTKDVCAGDGSCEHLPLTGEGCAPTVVIQTPGRASHFTWTETITVTGTALAPSGGATFELNGVELPLNADGSFVSTLYPDHGVNTLVAELTDGAGQTARAVQSFIVGESFYPVLDGPSEDGKVADGLLVFLGAAFFDDGDTSDLDDLATLGEMVLGGLDVLSLLPDPDEDGEPGPLTAKGEEPGFGWCQWTVSVTDVSYEVDHIDIVNTQGGVVIDAALTDIEVGFSALAPAFACPDAVGVATASGATANVVVSVWLEEDGTIGFEVASADVEVSEAQITLKEGIATLANWFVGWFADDLAGYLETAVEDAAKGTIAPILAQVIENVSQYQGSFTIPSILGATQPVPVTVLVSPSYLAAGAKGVTAGLGASATTPKASSWLDAPGSIARAGCFDGDEPQATLPQDAPIAMALHDDLLNEGLFAAWWGGLMNVKLDGDLLGPLLPESLSFDELEVTIDPHLPPILSSCTANQTTQLQVGDLRVLATFEIDGAPAAVEAWVSARVEVAFDAKAAEDATIDLTLGVSKVLSVDFQLVDATGAIAGSKAVIELLLGSLVTDVLLEQLADGFFRSFPVPQLDIGGYVPGIPEGTSLAFHPSVLKRLGGYTILSGAVVP